MRKLLGDDKLVRLDKGSLSLDEQRTWVDAWSLERLCAEVDKWGASSISSIDEKPAALAARLLGLYGADFLSGEDATWALVARERLRSKFMRSMSTLGQRLEQGRHDHQAGLLYQRGIEAAPLAEEFHRGLMRAYRAQGRVAEAVDAYRRCHQLLGSTLGAEPSSATKALYRELTQA